jgi:hypothetical protein
LKKGLGKPAASDYIEPFLIWGRLESTFFQIVLKISYFCSKDITLAAENKMVDNPSQEDPA